MLFFHRRIHRNVYFKHIMRRYYCHNIDKMSKIRNIGILAHIDAGKYLTILCLVLGMLIYQIIYITVDYYYITYFLTIDIYFKN